MNTLSLDNCLQFNAIITDDSYENYALFFRACRYRMNGCNNGMTSHSNGIR